MNIIDLIKDQDKCDQLLKAIDEAAKDCDKSEYGLPIYNSAYMAVMREVIYKWACVDDAKSEQEIYVVVADNDAQHLIAGEDWIDDGGPLVFEQYVKNANFENAKSRVAGFNGRFGKCRIAKLVFVDEEVIKNG